MMDYYGWPGMAWMGLTMLLFWGGLLVLGAFALRPIARAARGPQRPETESAEDILRIRLARGEISRENYEELRGLVKK